MTLDDLIEKLTEFRALMPMSGSAIVGDVRDRAIAYGGGVVCVGGEGVDECEECGAELECPDCDADEGA